jgi:hypothetical protein
VRGCTVFTTQGSSWSSSPSALSLRARPRRACDRDAHSGKTDCAGRRFGWAGGRWCTWTAATPRWRAAAPATPRPCRTPAWSASPRPGQGPRVLCWPQTFRLRARRLSSVLYGSTLYGIVLLSTATVFVRHRGRHR